MNSVTNGLPMEPLSEVREHQLARMKTEDAHNELALHAMHEAVPYARKVCRGALPDDELFSLCWASLLKAARSFKPNNARFFAYAKVSVRRGICDAWREKDVVKNASVNETGDLENYQASRYVVETKHADGDYAENLRDDTDTYGAMLGYAGIITVEPETEKIETAEHWAIVEPIMRSKLSQAEFMTLDLHYRGEMNFREIGDILGVVREAIRLTHNRAIKKIRSELHRRKALL